MRELALNRLTLPDEVWRDTATRQTLRDRDFQALFQLARRHGASQGRIASATGMTQSKVSTILNPPAGRGPRRITNIDLIERIADGFDIPDDARAVLGLASKARSSTGYEPAGEHESSAVQPAHMPPGHIDTGRTDGASRLHSPDLDNVLALGTTSRLSPATLNALESSITDFWQRDDQYGGEALRPAVTAQLRHVLDILGGCRDESQRRRLYAIAAELSRLTGWMLFDAQQFSTGRTYFEEALRLAREINDRPFIANVLASMSLQATYEDKPTDALALVRAAQDVSRSGSTPRVKSMLAMREAFAHATLGDQADCHSAIAGAQRSFEVIDASDDDPEWVTYFGETKLVADTGIALSQLGEPQTAAPLIEDGLAWQDAANTRTRAFHSYWLAETRLHSGDLDGACASATGALELASSVDSARIAGHLEEFGTSLAPHGMQPLAKELRERIGSFLRQ